MGAAMAPIAKTATLLALASATAIACSAPEPEPFSPVDDQELSDGAPLYCGAITAVGIETDIFVDYRVELVNETRNPTEVVVKDEAAVEAIAKRVGATDEELEGFDWWTGDQDDEYFACVWGEYDQEPFIRNVTSVKFWKNRALDGVWEASAAPSCDQALLRDFSVDSSSWQVNGDEIDGFWDTSGLSLPIAIEALARLESQLGCDDSDVEAFVLDQLTCTEVQPGNAGSSVCYGESSAGFYFLSRDMMTSVNIVFNRWD
jgi:hypothetical protein